MQDGSYRSLPSNTLSRITRQGVTRLPNRSRGQAYRSHHTSLEGVRLNARRILIVHCQATHYSESPGKESQGCTQPFKQSSISESTRFP